MSGTTRCIGSARLLVAVAVAAATMGIGVLAQPVTSTAAPGGPFITIGSASVVEGDVGTVPLTFVVSLSEASQEPVSVDWTSVSGVQPAVGVDYEAGAGTLMFPPGITERTVTVTVNGDTEVEPGQLFGAEWLAVALSNPTNGELDADPWKRLAFGLILDDDPAIISITSAATLEGDTGTVDLRLPVTLSRGLDHPVTVDWATASGPEPTPGIDYEAASGTVTFQPGETDAAVDIAVHGDTLHEPGQLFGADLIGVILSNPTGARINPASWGNFALGAIVDDDAVPPTHTLVSRASDGTPGDESSGPTSSVSDDGRYVAYESDATNLVPGDTNGYTDVFVHDRTTGATTRVSVASDGAQANGSSQWPSISGDGRYVAFTSAASNLVPGDTEGHHDVFVHDRTTGATTRASVGPGGVQADSSSIFTAISADGRYVAFLTHAQNLAPGDADFVPDIVVHDRATGTTARASVATDGTEADAAASYPSISDDGRYVTFSSSATNLVLDDTNGQPDVFLRDMVTATTTRVSVAHDGTDADNVSEDPTISGDGRYITYHSRASNLLVDPYGGWFNVFVWDRTTGLTTRVSLEPPPSANGPFAAQPSISDDGRYIAYSSTVLPRGTVEPFYNVNVWDRSTGITSLVSVSPDGSVGWESHTPAISGDGRHVTYRSTDHALVAIEPLGRAHIVMSDLGP